MRDHLPLPSPRRAPLPLAALLLGLSLRGAGAEPAPLSVQLPPRGELPYTLRTCLQVVGEELLILDLDGDGTPELVSYGSDPDTLNRDFVLATRIEGRVPVPIEQWNFTADRGGLAGTADLIPGDGREELLLWDRDERGLRLRVEGLRAGTREAGFETLWRSDTLPLPHAGAGPDLAPRMHTAGRFDAGRDLWVALPITGFGLAPRGPLLFAADGRLRRHVAMAPNVYVSALADLDGDDELELLLATHATCNGQELPGEDDCHSYWRVLTAGGESRLNAEAGGPFSEAMTYPLRATGEATRVAALLRGVSERCPLRVYAADGRLLRERTLPAALWRSLILDWNRDGADELLLGLTDGRLLLLDRELELLADWRFAAAVGPLVDLDLRARGRPELLLAVGSQLALFDEAMRPLALWDGELLYTHQLPHSALAWTDAAGTRRVGLSRGSPTASVLLELVAASEPVVAGGNDSPWFDRALGGLGGLLLGLGSAWLWLRRRARSAPAEPGLDGWRSLRDQLRGFRHSATVRVQLDDLLATLRSCQGENAARYQPHLHAQAEAFRIETLPLLVEIGNLAAGSGIGAPGGPAILADGKRLERLAAQLEHSPLRVGQLEAVERTLQGIKGELEALQRMADLQLAVPPIVLFEALHACFAKLGLTPHLEFSGDWTDGAAVADPDEAKALFAALAEFFAERGRARPRGLRLRAERAHSQLLVSCREEGEAPAPDLVALEAAGVAALATRLGRGLRCRGGEVQLVFDLVEPAGRRRRAAIAD